MAGANIDFLFRGESLSPLRPPERLEWLKRFHRTGEGLWTKLVNAGNPYALTQLGIRDAVGKHIATPDKFDKSHFLSFTTDEATALRYALEPAPEGALEDIDKASYADEAWTHTRYAVFRLEVSSRKQVADGVYVLKYNSGANTAVLIRATEFLLSLPVSRRSEETFRVANDHATNDQEWLVLPADPLEDRTLSACLRKGSDLDVDHYVEPSFFTDRHGAFID